MLALQSCSTAHVWTRSVTYTRWAASCTSASADGHPGRSSLRLPSCPLCAKPGAKVDATSALHLPPSPQLMAHHKLLPCNSRSSTPLTRVSSSTSMPASLQNAAAAATHRRVAVWRGTLRHPVQRRAPQGAVGKGKLHLLHLREEWVRCSRWVAAAGWCAVAGGSTQGGMGALFRVVCCSRAGAMLLVG